MSEAGRKVIKCRAGEMLKEMQVAGIILSPWTNVVSIQPTATQRET